MIDQRVGPYCRDQRGASIAAVPAPYTHRTSVRCVRFCPRIPKADIHRSEWHVRFGPIGELLSQPLYLR